jgi:hypothetical protein
MILKRTSPEEMLAVVQAFWRAHPGPLSGEDSSAHRFFVVPRYNALLRADPKAIANFFSYMSTGGGWRAVITKSMLLAACRSRWALRVAEKVGVIRGSVDTTGYPGVQWGVVDALVAEWQFVACFSLPEQTVTHCLSHERYSRCLHNEVGARSEVARWVRVPELKAVHMTWPSGWTEPIIQGGGKFLDKSPYFADAQAAMLRVYHETQEETNLNEYLERLESLTEERYSEGSEVANRLRGVIERVRTLSGPQGEEGLDLARCHGDLNRGQVIVEDGEAYLIDWSESEMAAVFHDLMYSAMFHYGWRDFLSAVEVPALETLRRGLLPILQLYDPPLMVGIVLVEVGVKQYVDYNEGRGTIKIWNNLIDHYIELFKYQ